MAPPAKRRKRNIVESEDDEDDAPPPRHNSLQNFLFSSPSSQAPRGPTPAASPSPVRKSARSATASKPSNGPRGAGNRPSTKSPAATPEKKGRIQKKPKVEEKGKSGNLLALFSRQSQKVESAAKANGGKSPEAKQLEAIASDPISEEDDVGAHRATATSFIGKNAQKRFNETSNSASSSFSAASQQRFLRTSRPPPHIPDEDLRPWSERFAPVDLGELAVHKKKVADVRRWLEDVTEGKIRQRLLVLKGAAGTAKTTTVKLLAKDMNIEILEWRNPPGSTGVTQGFTSASAQFDEFLNRGGRFGGLEIDDEAATPAAPPNGAAAPTTPDGSRRKLILIEEFPNTFMRSSSALTAFRGTVSHYLAANVPALATFGQQAPQDFIIPVLMIISETLLTTTSASADSFTAHRLLGPDLLRHPGTGVIEFNTVAPGILAKAMELVVQKEARKSGRRRTPGPQVLKRLGEIGDIRNAISSLEFLCLKGDDDTDWGAKVAFTKPKKGAKEVAMTKSEQETLEMVSQREASLGIFHAVGKVVYNKREELPYPAGSVEALREVMPDYKSALSRPKKSQVALESLIDETGTDTHTFISALHENYILSCERTGPSDENSSLDYISGCIEHLSESDLLCPSWDIFFGGRGSSGGFGWDTGSHILRQDEMAFQAAVRGLLFSLPSPVKRMSAPGTRGGDQFKMFYPAYLKLWRAKEEMEGLLGVWAMKVLNGEPSPSASAQATQSLSNGAAAFRKTKPSSVGDSAGNRSELDYAARKAAEKAAEKAQAKDPPQPPVFTLGNVARAELLLERLPYMALMARRKKGAFASAAPRDLEKVVSFQGVGKQAAEEGSDGEDDGTATQAGEAWATDKPADEATPRKKSAGRIRTKPSDDSQGSSILGGAHISKLVLSDDDIEDD